MAFPSRKATFFFIDRKFSLLTSDFRIFFVTLQDFSAFLCIKAVWEIMEKLGYELETVLNSTFCYELLSMNTWCWACNHLWLIIGCKVTNKWAKYQIYLSIFERENSNSFAWLVQELRDIVSKVIILSERVKSIHLFFLPSLLSVSAITVASYMAPARKVRIRLLPHCIML